MRPYLELVENVLTNGVERADRTGVGTVSLFGTRSVYDLSQGFPVVTTKKLRWRNAVKETLWFLRGETNVNSLGCGIWNAWARDDGDCGPIYGAQWRDFGGVDQINRLVKGLKENPTGRRHVVSAWNPGDESDMVLPPCHVLWQCYIRDGFLDIQLYQRSADIALGVPFNVVGYALILELLAREAGLSAGRMIHVIGDAHAYLNHRDGLHEQLTRSPRELPRLTLPEETLDELLVGDASDAGLFRLNGYDPHPRIRFPIAV